MFICKNLPSYMTVEACKLLYTQTSHDYLSALLLYFTPVILPLDFLAKRIPGYWNLVSSLEVLGEGSFKGGNYCQRAVTQSGEVQESTDLLCHCQMPEQHGLNGLLQAKLLFSRSVFLPLNYTYCICLFCSLKIHCLTNRGPDRSGSCLILVRQQPDQSGCRLILVWPVSE